METCLLMTMHNLQLIIEDTGASITYDPLPEITANENQIIQLLQNLVGNALKFRSDAAPVIHVGCQREGEDWLFSVRDNGIGIEPEYLERIFVIFQRLHARETYPGTGIGLAICKKIVELHDGRIWAESQPGKGATFYFAIPATYRKRMTINAEHQTRRDSISGR
jgi:chemotaxis family two-component system sensor kinase Cph1